ncbi:MAG: cytochrome B [Paracoccus sp. (in: a-proteobacteria)]|nr:cytochrome B [Paracoccus sp. (in: a-proteobacteria)]
MRHDRPLALRFTGRLAAAGALVTLPGCSVSLSALHPAGPVAGQILTLNNVLIFGFAAIWLAMIALFLIVMLRPGALSRLSIRAWLIWGGLALPLAVMVPLFIWTVTLTDRLWPKGTPDHVIEAEAFMWGWRFSYPEAGGAAAGAESRDILYLPQGREVHLQITSLDVIHSVWIPRLAGKLDATPGHTGTLRLQADEAGIMEGQCAEFCGLGHTEMRFVVDIRPEADYAAAIEGLAGGTTPRNVSELPLNLRAAAGGAPAAIERGPAPRAATSREDNSEEASR